MACGCNKDVLPIREVGGTRQVRTPPITITAQLLEPKEEAQVIEQVKKEPELPKRLIKFL
jgi:hypothetical protein